MQYDCHWVSVEILFRVLFGIDFVSKWLSWLQLPCNYFHEPIIGKAASNSITNISYDGSVVVWCDYGGLTSIDFESDYNVQSILERLIRY